MNEIFQKIVEFFRWISELLGIRGEWGVFFQFVLLSLVVFILFLLKQYWNEIINFLIISRRDAYKRVQPNKSKYEYLKALKYYVDSRWQDKDPGETTTISQNEFRPINQGSLISYLYNDVFYNIDAKSHYIIFADTGMGKSTFMMKLFFTHYSFKQVFLRKFHMSLIRIKDCNDPAALDNYIAEIQDKTKTILLLDGLDEDKDALNDDYKKRLRDITAKTREFHKVIITSRIQLPSDRESEFFVIDIARGLVKEEFRYFPMYLSPFKSSDIDKYLKKRFPIKFRNLIGSTRRRNEAVLLVERFKDIFARPLILNYIEELTTVYNAYCFELDVYDKIVDLWTSRETNRDPAKTDFENTAIFHGELKLFARKAALNMYEHVKIRNGHYLPLDEIQKIGSALSTEERRVQTLLTRTDKIYKFAHQSFMDYFISQELILNETFRRKFSDFKKYEQAHRFYNEYCLKQLLSDKKLQDPDIFRRYEQQSIDIKTRINKELIYSDAEGKILRDFSKNPVTSSDIDAKIKTLSK